MSARPEDWAARARAIDPAGSAIIQAPAGSGKTELLIQRYLALLATVDNPREVLAITFTRKATQEMAGRIRGTLAQAQAGQAPEAEYRRPAFELACAVLERDRRLGWQLLQDPAQLQIHTIDALCARLATLGAEDARGLAAQAVVEDARLLYAEAARRTIEAVASLDEGEPAREALEELLLRRRGHFQQLVQMLVDMLGRRDQWLAGMAQAGDAVADTLAERQAVELEALEAVLGAERIAAVARHLAQLADLGGDDQLAVAADRVAGGEADPDRRTRDLHRVLSALAIKTGTPMARNSVKNAFGTGAAGAEDDIAALGAISDAWRLDAQASSLFRRFVNTPPLDLDHSNAALMESMRHLLLHACAELRVLFAERGACDFQHVAELALAALGEDLDPGQALLVEDGRLQHVLVDEFQDTSQVQYRLLERLTAGWQAGDGRSLFLVGDPMQSIYRFRKADVGLYRQVFEHGRLGQVVLEPLRLTANFRSAQEVVDFVNRWLPEVFTAPHPAATAAVDYVPVEAQRPAGGRVALYPQPECSADDEAARVATLIAECVAADPGASVGVLVRKKTQLTPLALALDAQGVAFEAVEAVPLRDRQVVQDLMSLLRALSHPADRVAWLALLHAPWCGLDPAALLQVAGERFEDDVFALLHDEANFAGLPADTVARLRRLRGVMAQALAAYGSASLRRRVEAAWIRLHGPCQLAQAADLEDARAFLDLLSAVEAEQPEDPWRELQHRLERLFAGSAPNPVQLMTIHKAKGLEFDVVVLPGLEQGVGGNNTDLFRQHEFRFDDDRSGVLAAPVGATGTATPSLYRYLGVIAAEEETCETQRVLYVALTRAKRELHLFGQWKETRKDGIKAPAGSFLDLLWPAFEDEVARVHASLEPPAAPAQEEAPLLPHLVLHGEPAPAIEPVMAESTGAWTPRVLDPETTALGEAFHRWMELIHDHWGEDWLDEGWYAHKRPALESSLRAAGAPEAAIPALHERLQALLRTALANPQVRAWLAAGQGGHSVSEAAFLRHDGHRLKRQVIDLLRSDDGEIWEIVDWKTSETEAREAWSTQLAGYAGLLYKSGMGEVAKAMVWSSRLENVIDLNSEN